MPQVTARAMIAAVALMLSAEPAAADMEVTSGGDLIQDCREYAKMAVGQTPNLRSVGICEGYIKGALDGHYNQGCWPAGATIGQATFVVIKFLDENPYMQDLSAYLLVQTALREAWACPK
jgi:hypothetical protein